MTIKTLFFALFLYVCLVWVGAVYLGTGPEIPQFGLLWTAVGLIAVLAFIIGARLFGWWRLWRAKAVARPAVPAKSAAPIHEDDAALAALIADANATLAKAPAYAAKRASTPLSGMPLYLLIGPEGSGKTSTFRDSGLEPQLLAGQVAGTAPLIPTRLCNLWLAKDAIFAELSGRAFSGDLSRWTQLLQVLRGGSSVPLWRRLWKEPEKGFALRGVIGFCDVKEYIGTPNPQLLERRSRDWQQRLLAIGEVFGAEFPVYQIVTKCDAITFFRDFFRRLPESDANQVLGCTVPLDRAGPSGAGGVSVEDQAKRLTRSFRPLYQELAKRRITHLAHEPDPARRPAIYEFPREFKRIRAPLVQFLSDTFRPHPLRPGPQLRGYYLTAVREVEVALANLGESRADWSLPKLGMEATRLFSAADATRIFRPDDVSKSPKAATGAGLVTRWIFTSDLFHSVILSDRPARKAVPVDRRVELYRRGILGAACGLCALLCFAFLWSWIANHKLLGDLEAAAESRNQQRGSATNADVRSLDALRDQVERLTRYDRHGAPWSMRWGLYSGDRLVTYARAAYFRQFQDLLLSKLNQQLVARLEALPATPADSDPYDPVYNDLKTHLIISSGACKADPVFVSRVLRKVRQDAGLASGSSEEQALADRQIEFYASELPYGNPCHLTEDTAARDHARQYLQKVKGIDRIYANILATAEKALTKPQRLVELAPNYAKVLSGPGEVSAVFTPAGWDIVEKASKKRNTAALGESCVTGEASGLGGELTQDAKVAGEIQGRFVRDYISRWQNFVAGFSVAPYKGPEDAANKLEILAGHKSPLLALLAMTAVQTYFPSTAAEPNFVQKKFIDPLNKALKKAGKATDQLIDAPASAPELSRPADITRSFQPVHWVVPPATAGETWVGDKNNAYIDALSQLGHSMQEIGRNSLDPEVQKAASQNYDKAMDAARQIARGFKPVGVGGLDATVEVLLEQPILRTKGLINTDTGEVEAAKRNGELRTFCGQLNGILRKYPFQPSSKDDIGLAELASWFAPGGIIWKFQAKSLGDLTLKDASQWKAKDATKKPQVTPEILAFLTRAQAIADAFYPAGAAQPHLTYTLRPKLDSSLKDWTLTLTIDGQVREWTPTSSLQKQFTWPVQAEAKDQGAVGRIGTGDGGLSTPFASRGGLWGIFRIMGDAEPRPLSAKIVEWKYLRSGDGRLEALRPPAQMEIVEFPGGMDVFNPKFFEGFQCPPKAVQ